MEWGRAGIWFYNLLVSWSYNRRYSPSQAQARPRRCPRRSLRLGVRASLAPALCMAKPPKTTTTPSTSSLPVRPPRVSHTRTSAPRRPSPSPSPAVLGLFASLASAVTAVDGSPVSTPPPDFLCPQLVATATPTQAPTIVPRDRVRRRAATSSTSSSSSSRSGPVADKYVSCDDGRWRKTDIWTLYGSTFCAVSQRPTPSHRLIIMPHRAPRVPRRPLPPQAHSPVVTPLLQSAPCLPLSPTWISRMEIPYLRVGARPHTPTTIPLPPSSSRYPFFWPCSYVGSSWLVSCGGENEHEG